MSLRNGSRDSRSGTAANAAPIMAPAFFSCIPADCCEHDLPRCFCKDKLEDRQDRTNEIRLNLTRGGELPKNGLVSSATILQARSGLAA